MRVAIVATGLALTVCGIAAGVGIAATQDTGTFAAASVGAVASADLGGQPAVLVPGTGPDGAAVLCARFAESDSSWVGACAPSADVSENGIRFSSSESSDGGKTVVRTWYGYLPASRGTDVQLGSVASQTHSGFYKLQDDGAAGTLVIGNPNAGGETVKVKDIRNEFVPAP